MAGTTAFKQDLPPPGGYKSIPFLRVPAKTYFSGVTIFVIFNIIHFGGLYLWCQDDKKRKALRVENRAARLAIQPMLMAEKDRLYLKRCRELRDIEDELMKDVPGWVTGTYWGEPVYHTRPENEWHNISDREYFAHSPEWQYTFFRNFYKYL